jgi:NAD(P)-dependent dehydrogenase (short-subunit alcohol dehydrogenase family)
MGFLQGKRLVLTGASRGIGYETVKLFSAAGAEILGIARDAAKLKQMEGQFKGFQGLDGDLSDRRLAGRVAGAAQARWGALDALLNNAAIQNWNKGFHDEPLDTLEKNLHTNVLAVHWLSQALLPLLLKGREPRIVNVSSGAGQFKVLSADASMPSYRLSKNLLNSMTIMYALDLKGQVAVNALDPGWLKTDLGGPQAPGEPADGALRMREILELPFAETGKFWYGDKPIDF